MFRTGEMRPVSGASYTGIAGTAPIRGGTEQLVAFTSIRDLRRSTITALSGRRASIVW